MADLKISELAANGTLTGSELVEMVQGGVNVKTALSAVKTYVTPPTATTSVTGLLSSSNWTTFNNKASLASPTFTGTPSAPTADSGTNTTQLATTAFVQTAVTAGAATGYTIVSNSSTSFTISSSYVTTAGKTIVKLTSGSLGNITINGATDDGKSIGDSFTIYVTSPAAGTTLVASGVTLEGELAFTASSKLKTLILTGVNTWLVLGG